MKNAAVCKVSELPDGTMKTVVLGGKPILIANVGGKVFAMDDTCTHQQCSLGGEGFLDDGNVVCGCHGASFDPKNGKVLSLPATRDLTTYDVTVDGDEVMVSLGEGGTDTV